MKQVGRDDEIPDESYAVFSKCGSGGVALFNNIIIWEISSYLGDREIESWYESFGKFKHITDKMAQVCWRKRALKLANILDDKHTLKLENLEDKWPKKSSREIFYILVDEMIAKCNRTSLSKEQFLAAASLAHQGLLGHLEKLYLEDFRDIISFLVNKGFPK